RPPGGEHVDALAAPPGGDPLGLAAPHRGGQAPRPSGQHAQLGVHRRLHVRLTRRARAGACWIASPRMSSTARESQTLMRDRLIESRLTPNAISLTGFALCVVAAVLVWQDQYFLGGVAFVVGSVCDTLDGRYSRMSGKGTPFGAFLDSTLDRIEEGVVLTAVAAWFAANGNDVAVAGCVVTVRGSLMVSYSRARSEALGVECRVGWATR